jgi:riboflavin synthase
MFTGIVEETGTVVSFVRANGGARLTVRASVVVQDAFAGCSIAVNGCCLTATDFHGGELSFDLLDETLRCTNLGDLQSGALVNLERPLAANGRLGGHFVQGHIDCASRIISLEKINADHRLEVSLPAEFARYIVHKGSVAIDGISLTAAEVGAESFVVWLIPHTMEVTNLRAAKTGGRVNLEFDLLAKYIARLHTA